MTFSPAHHAQALTSESPQWDKARGVLWYIDIQGQRLLGHRPGGRDPAAIMLPSMPGFVALCDDEALILGLEDGLRRLVPETGELRRYLAVEADDNRTRLNEGKADADGRLWFGSMDKTGLFGAIGALYCLPPGGPLRQIRDCVGVPNGIDVTQDGTLLWFADSRFRRIERFALNRESGALDIPKVFVEYPKGEAPDGAAVDAEDNYWVTVVGGSRIDRYRPDGTKLPSLPLPLSRPTSLAFGGHDLTTLFVTSQRRFLGSDQLPDQPWAGSLLSAPDLGQGRPSHRVRL